MVGTPVATSTLAAAAAEHPFESLSLGSMPPEDFATEFRFPLDLIKVSAEPLIAPDEVRRAVRIADEEGAYVGDYVSGKYRLGGGWVKEYPRTLAWFNEQLEHRLFPALAALFPEIVRDAGVLRAHSVAMLKYNSSHPRTDVHTDNGILAMTLALSERADYVGGGTFYEHLGGDGIVEMDAGHVTLRPGSVRHGGHKVKKGERYILGAFLLIADRVEHVRRLNLQGSAARERGDAAGAARIFEWATKA